jgi:hypothetical protein
MAAYFPGVRMLFKFVAKRERGILLDKKICWLAVSSLIVSLSLSLSLSLSGSLSVIYLIVNKLLSLSLSVSLSCQ